MGKEVGKALISTAAGAGIALAITALFVPGPGWIVATVILRGMAAGLVLDWIDDVTENWQKTWAY
jgi:hypothetical protein